MKLLLSRHGNTFEAGEAALIVGRGEDMKLTQQGEAQAVQLAEFLRMEKMIPATIRCGELKRTSRMAEIIGNALALPAPIIDPRLTELDYGAWAGLTTDEVRARFGDAEVDAWDHAGMMPAGRGWQPHIDQLLTDIYSFADEAQKLNGITLVVTSNGVLRFFAKLVEGLFDELASKRQLKVGTGNLCCLEHDGVKWRLVFWNKKP